jgi:hypothetical protein
MREAQIVEARREHNPRGIEHRTLVELLVVAERAQ